MKKAKKNPYKVTKQGNTCRPVISGEELAKGPQKDTIEYLPKWVEEAGCWWIIPIEKKEIAENAIKILDPKGYEVKKYLGEFPL